MSWLYPFGGGNSKIPQEPIPPNQNNEGSGGGEPNKNSTTQQNKSQESNYRFDSAALERAASAAKDLEKSSHAKEALALAKLQEQTKQIEFQTKTAEYNAHIESTKLDSVRLAAEERRKLLQDEAKIQQQKANYEDQLARKRYADQLEMQKSATAEQLRRQEESTAKQEQIKQQTIQNELRMRNEDRKARIKEEADIKAKVERENRDIYLEQLRVKAQESRVTTLESIKTIGSVVGSGLNAFISDWDKMLQAAGAITLLSLGIYTTKSSTSLIAKRIESIISKPSLVRETSRTSPIEYLTHPISTLKKLFRKQEEILEGVILNPKLEERLRDVAIATKNTKLNRGSYRNVMFYGAPGTGKTLFAKRLAYHSGMDYAILSGGDVGPLGKHGVTAIHKVFDWAGNSRKGLVVFLDEADAFLRKRSTELMSEDLRSSLNAFLYRTGEQSNKIMIVLASNTPEQLDFAINDRIDEMVHFTLPGLEERERLIRYYFNENIMKIIGKSRVKIDDFDYNEYCSRVAKLTEGMSGREISKLGAAWQASAFASETGIFTPELMIAKAKSASEQNKIKLEWLADEEKVKTYAT